MSAIPRTQQLSIPSDLEQARVVQAAIESALAEAEYGEREVFAVKLALEEALVNAIKHGNRLDPLKQVHIQFSVSSERFDVRIVDEGPGFNPDDVPDPTAPENLERPCGRGLLLMRHYMSHVEYGDNGRAVHMSKIRNSSRK
jgi:serine/threonine-protein kinase RsbW